jgi:YfiH family protein
MNSPLNDSYRIYGQLSGPGFTAGMTVKGPWEDPPHMYDHIRKNLIPSGTTLVVPDQVHGVDIIRISDKTKEFAFEADGAITDRSDICLSVTTADCLPVIFADPISGYFAAVHVGWRGFVGGIVENIYEKMADRKMNVSATRFAIGPGIGVCCFEVGPEVAALFDEAFISKHNGVFHVNLSAAVADKLESLGAAGSNIDINRDCTSCKSELYYSYRRDKSTLLQMVTFIFKTK